MATQAAARFLRRLENGFAESAPPRSADCESRPLGRRANKRRVVSFLQGLGGDRHSVPLDHVDRAVLASASGLGRVGSAASRAADYPFAGRLTLRTAQNCG